MQISQCELLRNYHSIVNEIMEFFQDQRKLKVANNSIDRILGIKTILNDLDFSILQMLQHLLMQLFHRH
jgi:hypothetical protein